MTIADECIGILGLLVCLGIAVQLAITVWFGYTRLDQLLAYFPNSKGVANSEFFRHAGLKRRFLEVGRVGILLSFPRYYIRTGALNAKDLQQAPEPLKRYVVRLSHAGHVLGGMLMILGITVMILD